MTYALGIDLGTTYTAAAVARGGRAETAALGYRATSVPSVVLLTADGRFLVGDAAERRAAHEPKRVAREFKRRVGDPAPLLLGGTPIAVDRCLAEILRWVVATIGEAEGGPPAAVTVTHPANWGEYKQDVLREALRMVEIPHARLLAEPVAAATWYAQAERLAPGRTIAVYDLGGGTFDATVLRRTPDGRFASLGRAEGIERLGGIDVDEAVFGSVLRAIGFDRATLDEHADHPGLQTALAQLRRACVEAKEALSTETSVTVPVWLPGIQHDVLLQRAELEELVGPLLRPTVDALARVVASAGLRPDDLDAVLLVGGSSRIPLIGRQVSAGFGRPVVVDAHPKHPVALGAALDADAHRAALPPPVPSPPPGPPAAPLGPPAQPVPVGVPGQPGRLVPPPPGGPPPHRELPPLPRPRPEGGVDASSRRILLLASLATPVALVLLIVFTVLRAEDTPTGSTSTGGTPAAGAGGSPGATGAGDAGSSDTSGEGNLLADPTAVLQEFAAVYENGPPRIRELVLHPDLAYAEVQVPGEPTHVDQWTWLSGEMSGPEPMPLIGTQGDTLESELFDLSEIDPSMVPILTQDAMQNCRGDDLELTHVVVQRTRSFDQENRLLMLVYASNPERGGGGYIAYSATDGSLVENMCEPA